MLLPIWEGHEWARHLPWAYVIWCSTKCQGNAGEVVAFRILSFVVFSQRAAPPLQNVHAPFAISTG